MIMAKVGILMDQQEAERYWKYSVNVFGGYAAEILSYAGIPFDVLTDVHHSEYHQYDIVIAAHVANDDARLPELWDFMAKGGVLISYGGLQGWAPRLGCTLTGHFGAGYAETGDSNGEEASPLRFLRAIPWLSAANKGLPVREVGSIHIDEPTGTVIGPLKQIFTIGQGQFIRWSVDVLRTVVEMQQGSAPILADGIPAPDGSAPVNDGILKADDRVELDWQWDRRTTETGAPYFAIPYADYWRNQIKQELLELALTQGKTLPFVGYWPDGINGVVTISLDSDLNEDVHAEATLALHAECGISSTWCMLEPGYSKEIYDRIKEAGHELALHYNALAEADGEWSETAFDRQFDWLTAAADLDQVTTNKNHYTRFEGWGELFEWCEKRGIRCDQTRGPSKRGNVGFLFGSSHPYVPMAQHDQQNRLYNLMEIGFLTQDMDLLNSWSDSSIITPLLEQIRSVEGVAHFLFHPVHIHGHEAVRNAFRKLVKEADRQGFVFWTTEEIQRWDHARRQIRITGMSEILPYQLTVQGSAPQAVVWIPLPPGTPTDPEDRIEPLSGLRCRKLQVGELVANV
ncbi:hypothetical protein H1230_14050 [Paenibacillus sp. 19GGS1-52]|uniref:hypothetical protein n=1 Tax=Paenibacillus sp. 19GGS1-52 TaxID=2758563 RepID=UPI001EFC0C78|nr:hypothetical protein [Paenibacillus sp. 19GGS1-52]ULO09791.1 hypothetical protein H1230_14050 [Paenibacillus sp. 19GGS1-52]